MGGIYGLILLAWSVGAVPTPIIAYVHERTGSYTICDSIRSRSSFMRGWRSLMLLKSREQVRRSYDSAASKSAKLSISHAQGRDE